MIRNCDELILLIEDYVKINASSQKVLIKLFSIHNDKKVEIFYLCDFLSSDLEKEEESCRELIFNSISSDNRNKYFLSLTEFRDDVYYELEYEISINEIFKNKIKEWLVENRQRQRECVSPEINI